MLYLARLSKRVNFCGQFIWIFFKLFIEKIQGYLRCYPGIKALNLSYLTEYMEEKKKYLSSLAP